MLNNFSGTTPPPRLGSIYAPTGPLKYSTAPMHGCSDMKTLLPSMMAASSKASPGIYLRNPESMIGLHNTDRRSTNIIPRAPAPSQVFSSATNDEKTQIRPSLLWSKLNTSQFKSRIVMEDGDFPNPPLQVNPPPCSPLFQTTPLTIQPFRSSDLLARLDIASESGSTPRSGSNSTLCSKSAKTITLNNVYPETPLDVGLDTDQIIIQSRILEETYPEVIAATTRLVDGIAFLRDVYVAAAQSSHPINHSIWEKMFQKFFTKKEDNIFERAVSKQLGRTKAFLIGNLTTVTYAEKNIKNSTGDSTAQYWFDYLNLLRGRDRLGSHSEGKGDFECILRGTPASVIIRRDHDVQKIENAHGGLTTLSSDSEKIQVEKCFSAQIEITGICKSVTISDCDNTCVILDDVIDHVTVERCKKLQLQITGKVPSIVYN